MEGIRQEIWQNLFEKNDFVFETIRKNRFLEGYLDYGACGVHTEMIIYVCTEIHLVSHQTRAMHVS